MDDETTFGAIAYQKTGTTDESWDGGAAEKALGDDPDEATLRECYAWVDPDGDPKAKSSYKFPHHEVTDGRVGAANLTACSSVIAILNGGQGGADIPSGDRQGVYDHVAHHLKDGGKDVPEAKFEVIQTLAAAVSGGSGQAPQTGGDPNDIAAQLDEVVDSLSTGNADADGLIKAADNSVDLFLAARGITDPDEDITVGDNSDDDPADLARACQAALKAAAAIVSDNDDLARALDLADQLVKALGPDQAMTAAVGDEETPAADPQAFEMPIMVIEGVDTGDGRFIEQGVLTWREPPLPTMGITKTTMGHDEAELMGRLDDVSRIDISQMTNPKTGQPYGEGITALKATGVFTSLENAQQMTQLIEQGFIRGVSVDLGDVESVIEMVDKDGNVVEEDDPFLDLFLFAADGGDFADAELEDESEDDEEEQYRLRERITSARVMGVTICPFPAFEGAFIRLAGGQETPPVSEDAVVAAVRVVDEPFAPRCEPCEGGTMVASVAPMYPPRAWFEVEEPDELVPLTITDEGQVYGHAAGWQTCHRGYRAQCLLATKSRTDYSQFMVGATKTAEGDLVPTGVITMGTGHASTDPSVSAAEAMSHYDNTGTVAAAVRATNGKHGVWVCGALDPGLDELSVRRLRGSALSGDWRPHGFGVEMIAVLAVNTPGFLVPRVETKAGRVTALVAAGVVPQTPEKLAEAGVPPSLKEFMGYVLRKDAREAADRMRASVAESRRVTEAAGERVAARLRTRVHRQS